MTRLTRSTCSALLAVALSSGARAQEPPPPLGPMADPAAALRERGAATLRRLATKGGASWSAFHEVGREYLVVSIAQGAPGKRRITLEVERGGERSAFLVLLERDERMHAAEGGGGGGTYREREYPPLFGPFYRLVIASWPCVLGPDTPGAYAGTVEGAALYRRPATAAELERNQAEQEGLRAAITRDPEGKTTIEARSRLQRLVNEERQLRTGVETRVDVATGVVVAWGAPGRRSAIAGFEWRDDLGDDAFAMEEAKPPVDASNDPTRGDLSRLLMVGGYAPWAPGSPPGPFPVQLDARLVELDTKRVRRVPFDGPAALPGCFSRDRRRVYVIGHEVPGLFEVDLSTGVNRRVAGDALRGLVTYPAASPDGRRLAVVHATGAGPPVVAVIDLASDVARPIGEALEAGCLSWLPPSGGRPEALLLVTRTGEGEVVGALSLSGELRTLRRGSAPVLLQGDRILMLDLATQRWITCDLEGQAVQPFGDGFPGCGSPSPSPDGRQVVMVQARQGQAPSLLLIDVASGKAEPLELGLPGLLGAPAWR